MSAGLVTECNPDLIQVQSLLSSPSPGLLENWLLCKLLASLLKTLENYGNRLGFLLVLQENILIDFPATRHWLKYWRSIIICMIQVLLTILNNSLTSCHFIGLSLSRSAFCPPPPPPPSMPLLRRYLKDFRVSGEYIRTEKKIKQPQTFRRILNTTAYETLANRLVHDLQPAGGQEKNAMTPDRCCTYESAAMNNYYKSQNWGPNKLAHHVLMRY